MVVVQVMSDHWTARCAEQSENTVSVRAGGPYLVESASGTRLRRLAGGKQPEVIDAMASWWRAIHGYSVPGFYAVARVHLDRMHG
jgi:adenosylmethionine-8-amino-7-oxononanoate aminotransferase